MTNSRIRNLQGHRKRPHGAERTVLQISFPDPTIFSFSPLCSRSKFKLYLRISMLTLMKLEEN